MKNDNPPLQRNNVTLTFYNGATKKTRGQAHVDCEYADKKYKLLFQIMDVTNRPLLSSESCLAMKLITVNAQLVNQIEVRTIGLTKECILKEYDDVFSGLGCLPGSYHLEVDNRVTPVKHQPRRIPEALRLEVKAKIDAMEEARIIEKVTKPSDWISSMVVVKTPKKLRICLDPSDLNTALKRSHYLLPTVEEILPRLNEAKFFSVLDAKDGFLQIKLDEESSDLTTFWTPFGRYRWLRMPLGICSAPEEYQRRMHEILAGLSGVEVIADDILVFGCGKTDGEALLDHDSKLTALLKRARSVGLKLNKEKFKLRLTEVRYIGHLISHQGLKADPNKIEAIEKLQTPKNVVEIQRFLGFVNYLAKFLPKLSDVAKPLRDLILKVKNEGQDWKWEAEHASSFAEIKALAAAAPILKYYNVNEPVTIQCDASDFGLGASLLQGGRPVAYASKALSWTERKYAQIEKEALAIVFACERFEQYLCGRDNINVESDHKPLEVILRKPILSAPRRLQRMMLRLQKFNLNVNYKKGEQMYIADLLSRSMPNQMEDIVEKAEIYALKHEDGIYEEICSINQIDFVPVKAERLRRIKEAVGRDEEMQALAKEIGTGWPDKKRSVPKEIVDYWDFRDELSMQEGIILKGTRIIIPKLMRPEILSRLHESHLGIDATLRRAREIVYWPHMNEEVKKTVQLCVTCQETAPAQRKEPLQSHETPKRPWERVALDLFSVENTQWLVIVDYYSDFWELDRLHSTSSESIINKCKIHFKTHGIPDVLDSDNGPQFDCKEFKLFAAKWEFQHCTSSPYHHQSNGKAESAVKIAKKIITRTLREKSDLNLAILEWRNTPTSGMQSSPVQRLMSRRTRTRVPVVNELLFPQLQSQVVDKIESRKENIKWRYNKTARELSELEVGQMVRMKVHPERRGDIWKPGIITRRVGFRSYLVNMDGREYRRNRRHIKSVD
jgi:hypothetical protein